MRGALAGLVWIAACYTPEIAPGVSCSTDMLCPRGQVCDTEGFCRIPGPGPDAAIDAPADRDGDGVLDELDNCPDDPNPDQANEDGDRFGDVCDPCPPLRDDAPADFDKDGVADACDPNPTVAGDRIELFEGFHQGLPAWVHTPPWTASADAIRVDAAANANEYIVVPASPPDHVAVFASVTIDAVAVAPTPMVEVSLPNNTAANLGIGCELAQLDTGRYLSLWDGLDTAPGKELRSAALSWAINKEYMVTLRRVDTNYTCRAVDRDSAGAFEAVGTSSKGSTVAQPTAVIRARSATAVIKWVMVVRSP